MSSQEQFMGNKYIIIVFEFHSVNLKTVLAKYTLGVMNRTATSGNISSDPIPQVIFQCRFWLTDWQNKTGELQGSPFRGLHQSCSHMADGNHRYVYQTSLYSLVRISHVCLQVGLAACIMWEQMALNGYSKHTSTWTAVDTFYHLDINITNRICV